MAIGSAPEIGMRFTRLSIDELTEYYRKWKETVGPDLLGGYASLHFAPRYPDGNRPVCAEAVQPSPSRDEA